MNRFISSLCITAIGVTSFPIMSQNIHADATTLSVADFMSYPTYEGDDLGHSLRNGINSFKLWSPKADSVTLRIYDGANDTTPAAVYQLTLDPASGVWSTSISAVLTGKFYTFQVTIAGNTLAETPGVWAKAVSVNGSRAAIIDFSATNPVHWDADRGPALAHYTDAVIYEMHHRDFSIHPNSGIVNKGKFVALLENGTLSLNGEPTGIDHLRQLGVTHVHILPSFDYNSVDESQLPSNKYNWGYDPINYNVPDGSYSTNPADPACRIREMKLMVQALHRAGIGVIMDVVYNHTGITQGSNFELSAPGYYYRQRPDGSFSNASGCGNETASDRPQMHNFIVNSIKYWMREYHIDGFRFDLMAIHDIATMNDVARAAKAINPSAIIYGEGWTAGDSPLPPEQRALKENVAKMTGVAVFSDDIRDAVKGHYSNEHDRGFATGKPGNEETVKIGIVAATAHPQVDFARGNNSKHPYASSPEQIINYVSCHDDLTLTDKLKISMPEADITTRLRAARLAQTIILTSQGIPFIFAGEEIFRDKHGVHNSYNSPDSINAIDWNMKKSFHSQFEYYRNLIALRKAHPAFRLTSAADIARHIVFDKVAVPNLISYSIVGNAGGDSWREIKLVFNGSDLPQSVRIARSKWQVIARDGAIDAAGLGSTAGGVTSVAPYSALILAR